MRAAGKTRHGKRCRFEMTILTRKPDGIAVADIEIGMRRQERRGFRCGRTSKAVDVVMTVALGMGEADQGAECQILLHAEAGLAGQVLAGNEKLFAARAPFGGASGVDDRLVDSLAG